MSRQHQTDDEPLERDDRLEQQAQELMRALARALVQDTAPLRAAAPKDGWRVSHRPKEVLF